MQEQKYASQNRLQNLTSIERKEKLIDYVNEQRKHFIDIDKNNLSPNHSRSTLEPGIQLTLPTSFKDENKKYILPPVPHAHKRDMNQQYYLAHSLDLSQPELVKVYI